MKFEGGELTQSQVAAGLAVMRGEFAGTKVMTALEKAGVVLSVPAADSLIATEVKAGSIVRVTRGLYRSALTSDDGWKV